MPFTMDSQVVEQTSEILGLTRLSPLESQFVIALLRGVPVVPAGKSVGLSAEEAIELKHKPHVLKTLTYLKDQYAATQVVVNRDMLNMMLMEAHAKAGTATEEIMAIRELGKMNGCYEPERREVVTKNVTFDQIAEMDTDELLRLAGSHMNPDIEDADYREVH